MFKRPRHLTVITHYPATGSVAAPGLIANILQERLPQAANETMVPKAEAMRRAALAVETVGLAFQGAVIIVGEECAHDYNRKVVDKDGRLLLMVQVWK